MKSSQTGGVFALILCALLWSTGGFLVKLTSWNPFAIAGARSFIALITMCAVMRRIPTFIVRTPEGKVSRSDTFFLYLASLCYSLTMILFITANKMTTAANTILLQYTDPVWVILFGPLVTGEKNRLSDYLTVAGVVAGMILFFADGLGGGHLTGDILAALSGVTWGFCIIFMRRLRGTGSLNAFMISHLITFLFSLPFMFSSPVPSGMTITGLFLLGIFQIGLPSMLYARGINSVRALSASFISMIEPLMNPVWVALFMHEIPSTTCLTGGVIILGCVTAHQVIQHCRPVKE